MIKLGTREEWDKITNGQILGKDNCPFCDVSKMNEDIVWKGKYWFIVHNIYPYSGNAQHIMAIPKRHILYSIDLTAEELQELHEVHKFVKDFFEGNNYFSCTRETHECRSIEHYHIHFIPGRLQGSYLRKMLENQGFPIKEDLSKSIR